MSVRQRGGVQHLGSGVSGQLAENKDAWDAFTVLFPSITASGIPKNAALNAIMQIEKTPRALFRRNSAAGRYALRCGASSAFRISGQPALLDTSGAGIIAQSTPERELTETPGEISEHCALFNGVGVTVF